MHHFEVFLSKKSWFRAAQGSKMAPFGLETLKNPKKWALWYWAKGDVPRCAHPIFLHFPIGNNPGYNISKIQNAIFELKPFMSKNILLKLGPKFKNDVF